MECIYRWIQMSDIHFQNKKVTFNTKQLRDSLPEYLKNEIKEKINGMFLTGDYRFAPENEMNATKVVEYILQCAEVLGLTKNEIYTAPGNHDLSRGEVRKLIIDGVYNNYSSSDGIISSEVLGQLQKDFIFYKEMNKQLSDESIWTEDNPHTIVDVGPFYLLILNTALTACSNADNKRLMIGSVFIDACVSRVNDGKPIIAMGHHGFDWLRDEENHVCTKFLDNHNISLYLCGHSHEHWFSSFGEKGKQVNVGCFVQDNSDVYAGFAIGELFSDGHVNITTHKWDVKQQKWVIDPANVRENLVTLPVENVSIEIKPDKEVIKKDNYPFSIEGYHLLGALGEDGIKYYWKRTNELVESLAFNKRLKISSGNEDDIKTSAYTISTSIGCQLAVTNEQCLFCGTGMRPFYANLKAEEIALQCIFMAEYDSNCTSYPQVRDNKREFAFMGQGEPGMNYTVIREAILLNDYVMERIGQNVSRYIICTSGVTDFIPTLAEDIKRGVFVHPVTVHFSLNAIRSERNKLMPMNKTHDYHEFLEQCKMLYQITKRKISIGLLMFSHYRLDKESEYTLSEEKLEQILNELDSDVFRIDLCTVNKCGRGKQQKLSNKIASNLLKIVKYKGFEGKIFSSFGDSDKSGCGMLDSMDESIEEPGSATIMHFNRAVKLLGDAKAYRQKTLLDE
ncbi:metallophosphoesterase [Roseburia sp. BX1005]|uniref:Metallophosphoesterase n=1 Tax=Roseburia zhanii TaxID=2763064 RepID=A0A923LN95_9FIRM|nr:metallophosphoesterase [Roseburia zhanii]MBC5712951.1 metallophosphoesterase [Roseburia zhanii]